MISKAMFLSFILILCPYVSIVDVAEATSGRAMACSGTICLNEALPDPSGNDHATWPNGEWMEIYNSGSTPVDVLNWKLVNKNSKVLDFDSTTIVGFQSNNSSTWTIQPGDYMVIARNGIPNSVFTLTNSNDFITMEDSSGNVIDQASWNSSSTGNSLEEDPTSSANDWINTNTPTPGSVNNASTPPVSSDLVFNEVMANPWPTNDSASWPGGEWFEILNSGQSDMNLTGWYAEDAAGNSFPFNESHLVGSSMIIAPGDYRVVAINSSTGNGVLNNGAESLILYWPNGTQAQMISWSQNFAGFSLSQQIDNSWSYSSYPTPGTANPQDWDSIVAGASPVRISEVLVNSTMDGAPLPDGEWLELHNLGNNDIDLNGWVLKDGMGNVTHLDSHNLVQNMSQPGTIISADGRRLVQFTMGTELWDYYNQVMLIDDLGTVVHKSWWNNDPALNVSLIEAEDPTQAWVPASWPTPGQPEPETVTIIGDIAFNEILPDAVGDDTLNWPVGEWIELINNGNQTVDIANWHFTSGTRNFNINEHQMPFKPDTMVNPGEIVLVAINGSQGFYLKNSIDTIELRDSSNQIISSLTYNSSTEGESNWFWNGDWSQAPWATPGVMNPQTSPYSGDHSIEVTEILAHCSDGSITPDDDWVEVLNNGSQMIDLSAWRMLSDDGDLFHMRSDDLWNSSSMIIAPGERVVFTTPNWFISGLGGSLTIEDPDGLLVDFISWTITTDCDTMDNQGEVLPWPTPGEPEPEPSSSAGPEDLIFSRFMFEEKSSTKNDEFFEISNTGDLMAVLEGWKIRKTTTGGVSFNGSFIMGEIPAGSSVIVSPDANSVKAMGITIKLDADDVMNFPVWMPNSGATMQLIAPDGTIADTFVYGNGPTSEDGWNGPSIGVPVTTVDRILYLRGDGCGDMPDTDSSSDWEMRWSVAGASHFCGINTFSDDTSVIPLIGPDSGLDEVMTMLNAATDSIHLHVYQLHHTNLAMALIDAQNRGVDVTVVIHEPESWWDGYTVGQSLGIAWELESNGIDVLQFSSSSSSPYQYIHSKVAVVDSQQVWISSGNWKESSLPSDGDGNRDWGVIVDSTDLATIVLERMTFDEDASQLHVEDATYPSPDTGTYDPPAPYTPSSTVAAITGPINGELLTCPDDCMQGLADFIDSADSEILLSLQYLEMDWYWGWQENPLLDSLEDAAARGISIRLAINQHYANENPGIREVVNELNEWEGDVEAILMSENETVKKLHNKGVIVDGESVLISSINWGDNSILRNREMGLIIHSQQVTAPFETSFWEDWNRLDLTTDTDIDGIPDYWEVENNLSRTNQDSTSDPDGDGLSNIGEFSYGSNPHLNDTDGDCILDGDEILWAATLVNVSANDALTLPDADGDGVTDSSVIGCIPELPDGNTGGENNTDNDSSGNTGPKDSDGDGIDDEIDDCPDTIVGAATNPQGCSSEQRKNQTAETAGEEENSNGMTFMLTLIIGGIVVLLGAGSILLMKKKEETEDDLSIESPEIVESKSWEMPVLDGTSSADSGDQNTEPELNKFPGWSAEQIQNYLDSGWTEEQLVEWYQQQISNNSAED
jgi:phosphatidylserine/phosphatidylglycerophosphate/cardiolipin synthase-like enzyme